MRDIASPDLPLALAMGQVEVAFARRTRLVGEMPQAAIDLGYLHAITGQPVPPELEAEGQISRLQAWYAQGA